MKQKDLKFLKGVLKTALDEHSAVQLWLPDKHVQDLNDALTLVKKSLVKKTLKKQRLKTEDV